MTTQNQTTDFLRRIAIVDGKKLATRDILILYAIRAEPGMMGRELAFKIGHKSRSNVQDHIVRLTREGFIEDRRVKRNNLTPNALHITAAGSEFLDRVVPVAHDL